MKDVTEWIAQIKNNEAREIAEKSIIKAYRKLLLRSLNEALRHGISSMAYEKICEMAINNNNF